MPLPEGYSVYTEPEEEIPQPVEQQVPQPDVGIQDTVEQQIQQPVIETQQTEQPQAQLPEGYSVESMQEEIPVTPGAKNADNVLDQLYRGHLPEKQQKALDELVKRGSLTGVTGEPLSISTLSGNLKKRLGKASQFIEPDPEKKTEEEGLSMMKALTEGSKVFIPSVKKQLTSLWDAVTNPSETWEGMKALATDLYKAQVESSLTDWGFDPEELKGTPLENIEQTPALDFVIDDLKETWGTFEGFKKAVATDPAGIMVDLASVVAPVAKGVETAAITAKLPKVAKVAGVVAKTAALTDPVTAVSTVGKQTINIVSKLTGKVIKGIRPTSLYQSAVKMSTTLTDKERTSLANIALKYEILPKFKGLDKIDDTIRTLDNTIADMIDKADLTGKTMPINELFKDFESLKSERLLSTKAMEGLRAINRVKKSILDGNKLIERDKFTPHQVQQLKKTAYKDLKTYYSKTKYSRADVKAQKAVARAAKEYLESIIPGIKQLNKKDADLIALRQALDRPASRIENRDIIGLGVPAKVIAGTVAGSTFGTTAGGIGTGVGLILGIIDDPIVKSKIAILLNKLQKEGVKIPVNSAIRRLLGEQTLRVAKEVKEGEK